MKTGTLIKSVTLFLGGRHGSPTAPGAAPAPSSPRRDRQSPSPRRPNASARRSGKRMGDDKTPTQQAILNNNKTAAKLIESLKKQTHFSRSVTSLFIEMHFIFQKNDLHRKFIHGHKLYKNIYMTHNKKINNLKQKMIQVF